MEGVEDVSDVMLSTCSTIFHQTHLIKLKVLQGQKSWRNKFNKILIILLTSLIMYVKTRCGMLSYWHTFFFFIFICFFLWHRGRIFPHSIYLAACADWPAAHTMKRNGMFSRLLS